MAKGITEAVVEEIKSRIDLSDLVSSYGIAVRVAGASKKACCPFHHEKTPSFNINDAKGFYHCFGCGESGDAIKFVMKMDSLSFPEAVRKLATRAGVTIEEKEDPALKKRARLYALLAELAQFYRRCLLQAKEGEMARAYVRERQLTPAIIDDYVIGYAPRGAVNIRRWAAKYGYTDAELDEAGVVKAPNGPRDAGYHRFGGRLVFTIRDPRGRVVGFSARQLVASKNSGKYVNSPETPVFKKSNVLYGFDKAAGAITKAKNREAIVCEGQIDCIRLQTSGFMNAVAGQGTAFTAEHVRLLKKVADQVVLVYDDDLAGHKATIKSARLCLAFDLPVRVVSLPNGDDPDSFLRVHPAADFQKMLDAAESIMTFQVRAERAKEEKPDTVDAVNRVTKEILLTIAQCPSPILRATMAREAAGLLSLPSEAMEAEVGGIRVEPPKLAPKVDDEEIVLPRAAPAAAETGEDAAASIDPPKEETAFCEFLFGHEQDEDAKVVKGIVGEFLPEDVFTHPFTRAFVRVWCDEVAKGEDLLAPWSETLDARDRDRFDAILAGQDKVLESALPAATIAQDFVRSLWEARLRRLRGELPSAGDAAAEAQRMALTMDLKRIRSLRWPAVKEMVRRYIAAQ